VRGFKLVLAYDGAGFDGWQRQPGRRTVQGVLEDELSAVLGEAIGVSGAGRTDAGCHARGQVASFTTGSTLPPHALAPVLNQRLPVDLRVRTATEVGEGFDARRSAIGRRYAYRLLREDDLLFARIAWHPRRPLDEQGLVRAVAPLAGERDYAAFQSAGSTPVASRCVVTQARWRTWEGGLQLDISADHFLYHMVRSIVGTALLFQGERDPEAAMRECLASRDRARAGPTAPAHGLCLEEVLYPAEVAS
jgi:tRNA pseudouridine38-40 synthase